MKTPARLAALLTCLCFLPSGSAVAAERLHGAEGGNGTSVTS